MKREIGACLLCGEKLEYFAHERLLSCAVCGRSFPANAACRAGHFICDECHSARGIALIEAVCLKSDSKNPILLAQSIMENPAIYMHGPEHHVLVGAVLLTAYRNCGGALALPEALRELIGRGGRIPGGSCGFCGCCGAAVSAGIFFSLALGATPLETESWGLANRMTARALEQIGLLGGPRCCKRNSFTAIACAVSFAAEQLGIQMELPERILCDFSRENSECLGRRCPYHRAPPAKC